MRSFEVKVSNNGTIFRPCFVKNQLKFVGVLKRETPETNTEAQQPQKPKSTFMGPPGVHLHTGRSLTDSTIPDAVLIQFDLQKMSAELLETCRGIINALYNVIVHQVGHLPRVVPGCTVSKT